MDQQTPKQQLVERLKTANNVLVTVSTNPSVDQLAACIGLALLLNKQGKHATAVFSGEVPSTLEFLKPEDTLEKNTDSLRDFIISLDKSKADKLRYKVEDAVVKIFITPYRTSLSADDLEYSQGDFNVDLVVALGVKDQQDLDNAITMHGRILHDATVAAINTDGTGELGSINWYDSAASSLCELVVDLSRELGKDLLDNQIATALLTGIVAETARFSNEKTTPQTMSVSAELMSNGANQQLVASKLEGPSVDLRSSIPQPELPATESAAEDEQPEEPPVPDAGTLDIAHSHENETPAETAAPDTEASAPTTASTGEPATPEEGEVAADHASKLITEPPALGGKLTANTEPEAYDPSTDPLSLPNVEDTPMLNHDAQAAPMASPMPTTNAPAPAVPPGPAEPTASDPVTVQPAFGAAEPAAGALASTSDTHPQTADAEKHETLAELEQEVHGSRPGSSEGTPDLDAARSEVMNALNSAPAPTPPPVEALNAQPIDLGAPQSDTPATEPAPAPSLAFDPASFGVSGGQEGSASPVTDVSNIGPTMTMPLPPTPAANPAPVTDQPTVIDPTAPPPVPPPLPFQFGQNDQNR